MFIGTTRAPLPCGCTVGVANPDAPTAGTLANPWVPLLCAKHAALQPLPEQLRAEAAVTLGALCDTIGMVYGVHPPPLIEALAGLLGCASEDVERATDAADLGRRIAATLSGLSGLVVDALQIRNSPGTAAAPNHTGALSLHLAAEADAAAGTPVCRCPSYPHLAGCPDPQEHSRADAPVVLTELDGQGNSTTLTVSPVDDAEAP